MNSCGAFCSFCGKCGRKFDENLLSHRPSDVLPPGCSAGGSQQESSQDVTCDITVAKEGGIGASRTDASIPQNHDDELGSDDDW